MFRFFFIMSSIAGLSLTAGCFELINCSDCSVSIFPIEHVRVNLTVKSNGALLGNSEQCIDLSLDAPQLADFSALSGALVAPIEFTSRVGGNATLTAAYDTGQFTLNGQPLNSSTGTVQWMRFLGVRGLGGNRILWSQTINSALYTIEADVTELTTACP